MAHPPEAGDWARHARRTGSRRPLGIVGVGLGLDGGMNSESQASTIGKAWGTAAGLTVVMWGFQLFAFVDQYPIISLAVVVLVLWGLATIVAVWQPYRVSEPLT